MPVVFSCQSCCYYRYLHQEKSTLSQPIREVINEEEHTKSVSVTDPAALLSPTSHHHPMNTTGGTTSTRAPYYSSSCHRWEMSRRREPGDAIVYHSPQTYLVRTSLCSALLRTQPSRLRQQYFERPFIHTALKLRREDKKEKPDKQIAVVEGFSVELFFLLSPFRRISIYCNMQTIFE